METTSCLKAVVGSANQYRKDPSDTNLVHLQRDLDVLISISGSRTSLDFFDPGKLLPTECLSSLVSILNDGHSKPALGHKVMVLLSNLACNDAVRDTLHRSFHLTACLATFLRTQATSAADPITLQCVQLLQQVTYKCKISAQETYVDDLLQFLIKHTQEKQTELTEPCLGVLANLCQCSFSIQTHIKTMENMKPFVKSLMSYLSHRDQMMVMYSLCLLTSLCLHEELGQRLFSDQNINQTLQFMFHVLVNGDSVLSRRYTADLFIDLVRHTKVHQPLARYDHLHTCLRQILPLLCSHDAESVSKICELLLAFCSVDKLRNAICDTFFELATPQQPAPPGVEMKEPFHAVLCWACQSVDDLTMSSPTLHALDFLRQMFEAALDVGLRATAIQCTDIVLPTLVNTLIAFPTSHQGAPSLKNCQKTAKTLQFLTGLCNDEVQRAKVAAAVDATTYQQLLHYQFENNSLGIRALQTSPERNLCRDTDVDIVLYTLELMLLVCCHDVAKETELCGFLQDCRMVPFLAYGLTSESRDRVRTSLRLVTRGAALDNFPSILLGDAIAASNATTQPQSPHMTSDTTCVTAMSSVTPLGSWSAENKENMPHAPTHHRQKKMASQELEESVQSLIDKMQKGLELKDLRASEIINIYEHQLLSLQTKENHLQDLLEAKAMALSQADRLIAQYRCRRAQSEAEARQLRSLLQQSEKRCEDMRERQSEAVHQVEQLQMEVDELTRANARLETIAEEHAELTHTFTDQTQRLESVQRALVTLKAEHETMTEMQEMLRRHNDTLKQQHDAATEQVAKLEEERKHLSRQLKDKDTKLQEVSKSLHKTEERLKDVKKIRDELETAIDSLRDDLSKTEQKKKDLQHKVSTLEVVCQQHETAIAAKDGQLKHFKLELDKHAQIAALIHNLSSTKDLAATQAKLSS
ncbi:hypothetical protein NP493_506g00003 [Ridgeia piscesae]|uniref:CIP2A N-terminal domain-containing protein n=1 Tax=Ridgeia piscesae TaxID=27915 RepID=A0AAD9NSQ0_RIDPI|nr:hypothetical protein NP493_506g00003 [Ridgeia piscesae]